MNLDEKKKILTEKQACFKCAKTGHLSRRCHERKRCSICNGQHIVQVCPDFNKSGDDRGKRKFDNNGDIAKSNQTEMGLANWTDTSVFLQTLVVKIRGVDNERKIRAIIDTGSQRSYLLKSVAIEMKYEARRTGAVIHALFGGNCTAEQTHNYYEARLCSMDGNFACKFEVLEQAVICGKISSNFPGVWTKELNDSDIHLTDTQGDEQISLLIGADVAGKLYTGNKKTLPCGLTTIETLLGWVLMGKIPVRKSIQSTTMTVTCLLGQEHSICALWQLDVLGICDPIENKSKEEMQLAAKELFVKSMWKDEEERYEVSLPWIEGHPPLPTNYVMAKKGLDSISTKLMKTDMWQQYNNIFLEWLDEGIIEEVPADELKNPSHYLPHRPVIKETSATTKIRPVFDASAKERGSPALNDCLEKGPNMIEKIPDLLLQFRMGKIGVTADIKKAFLQIGLNAHDRNFLRFLWKSDDGSERTFRHRRVVFGVNASPYLLGATIDHHLKQCLERCMKEKCPYTETTILQLINGFYVDNCVVNVPTSKCLEVFIQEASELMAVGKFDLRGWEFSGSFQEDVDIPLLGLKWNKKKNTLSISKIDEQGEGIITKRVILSLAQKIFDPIGFTCPATLSPKLLLQGLWKEKIGWDTEVTETDKLIFQKWKAELPYLSGVDIPRWTQTGENATTNLTLHVFCDASQLAYSTEIFLRVEKENVKLFLLQAKTRVAPIRKMSIPRLELLAATISARLASKVKNIIGKEIKCYYWSDSTTVLYWIKNLDAWAIFVWNRVSEIRTLSSAESWRHVPGKQYPADLPSRGCFPKQLAESKWWEGPDWLRSNETDWPCKEINYDIVEINVEKRKNVIASMLSTDEEKKLYQYFSKYSKIVRCIAWMYRFANNCRKVNESTDGLLSVNEFEHAEQRLIWIVQRESFAENDERLSAWNTLKDKNGILRLESRVSRRQDIDTYRYPCILPGKHEVVKKLILHAHEKYCHAGVQGLLSLLREKYWILGGRRTIRSAISSCVICKRFSSKKLEAAGSTLPNDRVREAACFEITGVDLAGPMVLRGGKKAWVCLFTCAVYRAVHLETVCTLSTAGFLQVLRRFIGRRGRPTVIYSDNGTNFCGTENLFQQLNWEEIRSNHSVDRIRWNFNPPSAPWWGGWWERLIGILKRLLRKVLGRASLGLEELNTILCDCEAVINSRPLCYVSEEPSDLVPLTPAMFLRELSTSGVADCDQVDEHSLNKRFVYLQKLREDLRKRFRSEYLGQLQSKANVKPRRQISIGEIVLIGSDQTKTLDWPLGRVIELLPGKDNNVRLVRVQTEHGCLLRPIQRLYPLECLPSQQPSGIQEEQQTGVRLAESDVCGEVREVPENVPCATVPSGEVSKFGRVIRVPARFK